MNNAVIYARYSSQGQNEQSIEGQIRVCEEFAESKGFKVVKTYIDKAKSAWSDSDKRIDFNKMLNDAGSGAFQHIIVYKFDRFARNRLDSMMHKAKLKKEFGIRVLSATEPVSDDEGGEIYEMFLEWNDEKYSQRLSKRVRDGFDTSVANGNFTGGIMVYGYKLIREPVPNKPSRWTTRIEIDDEAAENIRFIFEEYAKGTAKKQIADMLNQKGRRYNEKPFKMRSFDNWLMNSKYYGHFTFAGRTNDTIYPAIISQEIFEKAQERLKHNRHFTRTNHTREKYMLTGKIFCGYCNSLMTADGANKKGKIYRFYGCKTARKGECCKKLENKTNVENVVVQAVLDCLKDDFALNKIVDYIIKQHAARTDENALKSLGTRIQHAESQIEITTKAFIEAVAMNNDILKKNCDAKTKELSILADDLKKERTKMLLEQGSTITKEKVISFVKRVLTKREDETEQEFHERLVDVLVKAVHSDNDKLIVWFYFDFGTNFTPPNKDDIDEAIKNAEYNGSAPDIVGGEGGI